ncbi:MAG: hypothetical protein IJY22_05735 [Clostridia bacterium]|nr:hypothetical protein [Clostridia bacterium]
MPARWALRQLRALCQLLEGKCEVGNVLLCRDGSLAKRISVNERALGQNLSALQKLKETATHEQVPFTIAVVPPRILARATVLPGLYQNREIAAALEKLKERLPKTISFPDLTNDDHWYRTDHHWSTAGAFSAYCTLQRSLGFIPYAQEDFCIEAVSESFYGTSHAAAGIPFITPDVIQLYRYAGEDSFSVLLNGKLAPFAGFYDFGKLDTRDGYGVFFGGNYGTLEITDGTDRPSLLVIKDSFANALLPFLARHYNVLAVDPRYTTEPLSSFVRQADQILVLVGMQTLCESALLRTLTAGI